MKDHGPIVQADAPQKPWLVHVVRKFNFFVGDPTANVCWRVWCPCCRTWTACASFAVALDVVARILPGVRR